MCTETFLHLPEEKRDRILNAAWDEFTAVPFAAVSVNQIIRRAGIPRGSFYQYFADKSDLFAYLMDSIREQLMEIFHEILAEAHGDIFRTALMAYEHFQEQREYKLYPVVDRLIHVIGINPKIDMESLMTVNPDKFVTEAYFNNMDLSIFRQRDTAFVLRVCRLTACSLTGAIIDCLREPGRDAQNREELMETLEIIRRGSVRREILEQEAAEAPAESHTRDAPDQESGTRDAPDTGAGIRNAPDTGIRIRETVTKGGCLR